MRDLAVFHERDHHLIADLGAAIPGAVLSDEQGAVVAARELVTAVEGGTEGSCMCAELPDRQFEVRGGMTVAELRIDHVAAVDVRIAVMGNLGATRVEDVQFAGRCVIAKPVAAVIREPQAPISRFEVEADSVSHAACGDVVGAGGRIHAQDCHVRVCRLANVARSTHGDPE